MELVERIERTVDGPGTVPGGLRGLVDRFDHVALAVDDLEGAVDLYHGVLGGELIAGGDDRGLGTRGVQLRFDPGVKIEILSPLPGRSVLTRFLDKHGPGMHHVTCFVHDVPEAVDRLTAAGYETVDTDVGDPDWRETFLRPSSGFGALLQLVTSELDWSRPLLPGATVEDVLAGRVDWNGVCPTWRADDAAPSGSREGVRAG